MDQGLEQAVARGSEQLKQGKLADAMESFKAALVIEPGNAKVLALLGLCYFRSNEFEHARPIYESLVEKMATDASHRLNLGLVYLKLGEADLAINALEASRALDPSQGRATSYLGLAYARAGRYIEAYRSFLRAGQNDLAIEIEQNLTQVERDGIHGQLGRTPTGPMPGTPAAAVVAMPSAVGTPVAPPAPAEPPPAVARTTSNTVPRTKPPSAPPGARTKSEDQLDAKAAEAKAQRAAHESSPEITIITPTAPAADPDARLSESMQFVMPTTVGTGPGAIRQDMDGRSAISQAVHEATPASGGFGGARTKTGGYAPRPLSELATEDLVRADDGDDPFEIATSGALVIRVTDKVLTRLDGIHLTGGDLTFEFATRRSRGHQTPERFEFGGYPMHSVAGHGYLIAIPNGRAFTAVALDDDIFYIREDLIFAFESTLRWENGNVPGLRGKLPVVQFRGDGAIALRLERPLVRVKLPSSGVLMVDTERLAGWIGRVIPRAVVPPGGGPLGELCVECTGEGVVLVEPAQDPTKPVFPRPAPPPPPPEPVPVPPSEPVQSIEAMLAEGLDAPDDAF